MDQRLPQAVRRGGQLEHVYWTNSETHAIGRAAIAGTGVEQAFITVGSVTNPSGLAINTEHIYVLAAWEGRMVVARCELGGEGGGIANFVELEGSPENSPNGAIAVNSEYIYWGLPNADNIGRAKLSGLERKEAFIEGVGGVARISLGQRHLLHLLEQQQQHDGEHYRPSGTWQAPKSTGCSSLPAKERFLSV